MELTSRQTDLLRCLHEAVENKLDRRVVYGTEWMGWLPFPIIHWVEDAKGQDIWRTFPQDWSEQDLNALEAAGHLKRLDKWVSPDDEFDTKVTYEVLPVEADAS